MTFPGSVSTSLSLPAELRSAQHGLQFNTDQFKLLKYALWSFLVTKEENIVFSKGLANMLRALSILLLLIIAWMFTSSMLVHCSISGHAPHVGQSV